MAVDVPVYVTKDDAREAQHAESTVYGGQNPRGGMAAQMQVSIFTSTMLDETDQSRVRPTRSSMRDAAANR